MAVAVHAVQLLQLCLLQQSWKALQQAALHVVLLLLLFPAVVLLTQALVADAAQSLVVVAVCSRVAVLVAVVHDVAATK